MDLGPHGVYVMAAYGSAALVLAGLLFWLALDGRRQARALKDLEQEGIWRRSDARSAQPEGHP